MFSIAEQMMSAKDAGSLPVVSEDNSSTFSSGADQFEVPEGHGLMIRLHSDGSVTVETVADKHYPYIHPNCNAPADLENVHLLYGGGSGTSVFGGDHPTMEAIVMKHGGPKDTKEVFALASITAELRLRRSLSVTASDDMTRRIPEFVMVYISPHHLRDRGKELWTSLRTITYTRSGRRLSIGESPIINKESKRRVTAVADDLLSSSDRDKLARLQTIKIENPAKRTIRVNIASPDHEVAWHVGDSSVDLTLPRLTENGKDGHGIAFLRDFGNELINEQNLHNWKVTLAEKWIGGPNAVNGADVLTSGNLQGALLDTMIREFTAVMQDLDRLTFPEERQGRLEIVKKELERLKETQDVRQVSKTVDSFVGRAICKNFHPRHGRFRNLRLLGEDFREADFFLTEAEQVPARFLGMTLQDGARMNEIFEDAPSPTTALDEMENRGWLDILEHATRLFSSASATDCLWTCGLTDAGLHNTFLCVERGLELFDLGEPGLVPRPAFLTKFLMSFFHTLGMESDGKASWKSRFSVVQSASGERLSLTSETKAKIPYLRRVFTITVDHFIQNIFNGDECVRKLLLKYIVLQLLSDASFCLQRWESKGGGTQRYGERLEYAMEKWLWRSLWDQYIASYVYFHLLMNQPEEAEYS